jgi:hypothetical protein
MKMYNQYDKQYSLLLTIFFDLEVCACYLISELLKLKKSCIAQLAQLCQHVQ